MRDSRKRNKSAKKGRKVRGGMDTLWAFLGYKPNVTGQGNNPNVTGEGNKSPDSTNPATNTATNTVGGKKQKTKRKEKKNKKSVKKY
jgi:hypothetical protein